MTTLKVLIADDEEMARRRLRRLLSELRDVELVAECATGAAALSMLESIDVDVAVLDVQMPGLSGLDVSQAAAELGVEVIFATAHPEHAIAAYARGALDYVLKPVAAERLAVAVDRARARVRSARAEAYEAAGAKSPIDRLAIAVNGEVRLLVPSEVAFAMLDGALVRLRVGEEMLWTELTLQELEVRLAGRGFLRVHRRALLNLAHVDRLRPLPTGGYVALTRTGDEVPVSRQEARRLRQRLGL
ncbi:MAG: DNA-binding response regulator [Myxococcaceae bacterium]|nr:DNA-binding response regulator [Myxococcaceae bacterium]